MQEHVTDPYVRKAQAEGMRSRAAYKLQQLAERDNLLKPGMVVVDLGSAPGGWSQVAGRAVGPEGRVVGVDLLEMLPVPGVRFVQGDFGDDAVLIEVEKLLDGRAVDLVLSDMAPNMSGVASVDQARQDELCAAIGEPGRPLADIIAELVAALGMPRRLRDSAISKDVLRAVAQEAMSDRCLKANARTFENQEEVFALLEQAW